MSDNAIALENSATGLASFDEIDWAELVVDAAYESPVIDTINVLGIAPEDQLSLSGNI